MATDSYTPETDHAGRRWTWTQPDDTAGTANDTTVAGPARLTRLATRWQAWRTRRRWRHEWTRPYLAPGDRDPYVEHRAILSIAPVGNHQPRTLDRATSIDVDRHVDTATKDVEDQTEDCRTNHTTDPQGLEPVL